MTLYVKYIETALHDDDDDDDDDKDSGGDNGDVINLYKVSVM